MGLPEFQTIDHDFISVEDYLEGEQIAEERHEYVNGQVFVMAGASEAHEIVAMNLSSAILSHLRGKGWRVFKGGMKVRLHLNEKDLFYYPDIMVVCDPADSEPFYKTRPKLIVEVMTEYKADHVEKLFAYQQIETLEEYLVVDQNPKHQQAWLYRNDRKWSVSNGAPDGTIRLESIDFTHGLKELYVME
jgi:Uma2 family endonuclease